MEFENIFNLVIALGGFEMFKWAYHVYVSRDKDKVVAKADAERAQFENLKQINEFLQQQLKEKEERFKEKEDRFVDQTARLRKTQDELFEERKKNAQLEIMCQNAELWRCNIKMCGKREPPNGM